ncbi:2041_t:CDS:2 [Funneliformis mosseae]|uniref:2041_t:CDS:1 n=1 Tax=Funneliformis mosseae TaxID=27381 RepID=A0A9N9BIB8_FUNMO|nr:2041_t:CDS:2 [Funneliformis mosseae]
MPRMISFHHLARFLRQKLFVDGQWDHTCMQLQKLRVKANDDSRRETRVVRSRFRGIGAISVYFYKAKDLEKLKL